MWTYTRKTGIQPIKIMDLSEKIGMQPSKMWGLQNPRKIASTKHNRKKEKGRRNRSKQGNCLSDPWTRYTPHRRPWRFGHFLQLALTFVHQHFLQGTSAYLRFVPFFSMFQETLQCSEELSWWHGSLVLSPRQLKHEFRNYWRKTVWPSFFCVALYEQGAPPHPSPCPTSWHLRNINNVCSVQGTLTCPTVNMHPTPAPAPHPGRCGTSTTCATYKER